MDLSRLTLAEWYEGHFVHLFHADARPGTIAQYENTLAIWRKVAGGIPVAEISTYTLANFRAACPGVPATVAKHLRHLNHLLGKLGPPGRHNRDALGILPAVPWVKAPRSDETIPRVPADDQLNQFILATPIDLALFAVIAATTGSRNAAIRGLVPENADHTSQQITFPPHTDKRRRERRKPIPDITSAWLQKHGAAMSRWKISASGFAQRWNRHAARAGAPTLRPHGLKRWWGNALRRHSASQWAIRYALDHAQRDVTGQSYLDALDELAGLVDHIPLPEAFTTRLRTEQQIMLPW